MMQASELLKCYGNKLVHKIAADRRRPGAFRILHDAVKMTARFFPFARA